MKRVQQEASDLVGELRVDIVDLGAEAVEERPLEGGLKEGGGIAEDAGEETMMEGTWGKYAPLEETEVAEEEEQPWKMKINWHKIHNHNKIILIHMQWEYKQKSHCEFYFNPYHFHFKILIKKVSPITSKTVLIHVVCQLIMT